MSVEFYRGSPGSFDSRTPNRTTLNRWTGRTVNTAQPDCAGTGHCVNEGQAMNHEGRSIPDKTEVVVAEMVIAKVVFSYVAEINVLGSMLAASNIQTMPSTPMSS